MKMKREKLKAIMEAVRINIRLQFLRKLEE